MGNKVSKTAWDPSIKAQNEVWLKNISPVASEFQALMIGIALGSVLHEGRFGLQYERERVMLPLQKLLDRIPGMPTAMHILGMFADGVQACMQHRHSCRRVQTCEEAHVWRGCYGYVQLSRNVHVMCIAMWMDRYMDRHSDKQV